MRRPRPPTTFSHHSHAPALAQPRLCCSTVTNYTAHSYRTPMLSPPLTAPEDAGKCQHDRNVWQMDVAQIEEDMLMAIEA